MHQPTLILSPSFDSRRNRKSRVRSWEGASADLHLTDHGRTQAVPPRDLDKRNCYFDEQLTAFFGVYSLLLTCDLHSGRPT